MSKIEDIRKRLKSAKREAPYPWALEDLVAPTERGAEVIAPERGGETIATVYGFPGECDAEKVATFIAHAPEDIAFLLREVERLTEERSIFLGETEDPRLAPLRNRLHDIEQALDGYGSTKRSPLSKRVSLLVGKLGTLEAEYTYMVGEAERLEEERNALRAEVERLQEGADRMARIQSLEMTADDRGLFITAHTEFAQLMANGLIDMMRDTSNYWEQDLRAETRFGDVRMLVTTIKPDGLSPHQLRAIAEAKLERARAEVERLKSAPIVRRPIDTLPEEREGTVLIYEVGDGEVEAARPLHPGHRAKWASGGAWTHWSPLPPLAEPDALPTREESDAELRAAGLEPGKVGRHLRERIQASAARPELHSLMVEGWEMPETPEDGAVPRAAFSHDSKRWLLLWTTEDEWGPCSHGFISWPFLPGVTVTPDMLRALGFTVEEA